MVERVIFISGKKRSGKDTLASFLKQIYTNKGKTVEILHFADNLKQLVAVLLDVTLEDLETMKNENKGCVRQLLQSVGEKMKEMSGNKHYWVDLILDKIESIHKAKEGVVVIIPDYRFPYEAEGFENYPCEFIRVENDNVSYDNHNSELALDNVAFPNVVDNNGSMSDLKQAAESLVEKFR